MTDSAYINFENCTIRGGIDLHSYQSENNVFVSLKGCTFTNGEVPEVSCIYWNTSPAPSSKDGDYTRILLNGNNIKSYFVNNLNSSSVRGLVLHIASNSPGTSQTPSSVRFNTSSSAFNIIVGNSELNAKNITNYGWDTQYGYVYRDGGVDINGQAFGSIDVDPTTHPDRTLAKLLGDCSSSNKVLGVSVNGTNYTITFNEDYTSKDNAYIIDKINSIIGTVATASLFCPAKLYYPNINGMCSVVSADEGAIRKGMGVVFTDSGMRRAKNSDGFIDGICLDATSLGQVGRVITKGYMISGSISSQWFSVYDYITGNYEFNQKLGISTTTDG